MIKIFCLSFVFLIIADINPLYAQTLPKYTIDCKLDTANHTLEVEQQVEFTNNTSRELGCLYFYIYPNRAYTKEEINFLYKFSGYFKVNLSPGGFDPGSFQLSSLMSQGKDIPYAIEGQDKTLLRINLPSPLKSNETVVVDLVFNIRIPHMFGRFGWHENIIALYRWYPILAGVDEKGWHLYPFYLFHQPYLSESSHYKVTLKVPAEQVVAHSGSLKTIENNADKTKTLVLESDLPLRDFSLAVSPDYKVTTISLDDVEINSYYLEGDKLKAEKAAKTAKDLMHYYGERFGKYPYKEFNIAPVYLAYGGHETSNGIFIDTRVYKLPGFLDRYFEFLIAHETGHQWFYNLVGSDEFKETFMDEALNSYWLMEYLEGRYGKDAKVLTLPKSFSWLIPNFSFKDSATFRYKYMAKQGQDRPIIGELSSFKEPSFIFALAYGKGQAVISMLEALVGEKALERIMRLYASDFRFKNAKLEDFIKICNRESKLDLNWFFQQWLYTDKKCDYYIKDVIGNRIILENKGDIVMPIKINIIFEDKTCIQKEWDGLDRKKEIIIDSSKKIKEAYFDTESLILDLDQTNNYWPRRLNIKPVPLHFFAYDIPVFLPANSYNLVFGPEVGSGIGAKVSLQKPYDSIFYLSSSYDFGAKKLHSSLGAGINHIFHKQITLGLEAFRDKDYGDEEDVEGGKIYLRQELWPARYGLTETNDHITLYLLRDRKLEGSLLEALQDGQPNRYKRRQEAIVGFNLDINRAGPYPDPIRGYKLESTLENAGHFFGGKEAFWRNTMAISKYQSFIPRQTFAGLIKYGWGYPRDKYLFYLGGGRGLRGYDIKDIKGSNFIFGSLEYRINLIDNIGIYLFDNIINVSDFGFVGFFDSGKSWFSGFKYYDFKKDVGLGLRLKVNLGSFLEKIILRFDAARAINDAREDNFRYWFGISHAF